MVTVLRKRAIEIDRAVKIASGAESQQKAMADVLREVQKALTQTPGTEELARKFQRTFAMSRPLIESDATTSARICNALARRIAGLRESLGMNQSEFARRTGLAQSYVWHIERGSREPSLSTLAKVAAACGMNLSELVSVCDA